MMLFFFFQAEDGIRDLTVTGVQTCALPICQAGREADTQARSARRSTACPGRLHGLAARPATERGACRRSEERRVGKSVDLGGRRSSKKNREKRDVGKRGQNDRVYDLSDERC